MLFNNYSQNGAVQSGGYSVSEASLYPYSPASISSNVSSPGWAGQHVNSVHIGEQVQDRIIMNNSPVMTTPMQRQAPIPTIVTMDGLHYCATANPQSGNAQNATGAPAKQGGKSKKQPGVKRARTAYTSKQLTTLERGFSRDPYVSRNERIHLADTLHLSENQIKIWYQNRRMKLKKETLSKSGAIAKPLRPKKKAAATIRAAKRSKRTSTSSSASNSPPPLDAHRPSTMTPPAEVMPMMSMMPTMPMLQVSGASCGYGDVQNCWVSNGGAVFRPQQPPMQWLNADGYAPLPMSWEGQQYCHNNAQQYDATYQHRPSGPANAIQGSAQESNIFSENYQLPVLGDLSAWLDHPQDEICHQNFTNL